MTRIHPLIRAQADDDREHDPWGTGMMTLAALCDVLVVEGGDIPPEAGYRRAMGFRREAMDDAQDSSGEFSQQRDLLAGLYPTQFPGHWVEGYEPNLTIADLEYAALVLARYLDLVKLAGRSY